MKPSTLARVLRALHALRTPYREREWDPSAWEPWFAWRPVRARSFVRSYPNLSLRTETSVWTFPRPVWLKWIERRALYTKPGAGTVYEYRELSHTQQS